MTESWQDRIIKPDGPEPDKRAPSGARHLDFIPQFNI